MVFVINVLVGIQLKGLKIVSHQYSYENHLRMFHRCLSTIRPYLMTSVMAGIFRKANMIQLPDKFCQLTDKFCQLKLSDLLDIILKALQELYNICTLQFCLPNSNICLAKTWAVISTPIKTDKILILRQIM